MWFYFLIWCLDEVTSAQKVINQRDISDDWADFYTLVFNIFSFQPQKKQIVDFWVERRREEKGQRVGRERPWPPPVFQPHTDGRVYETIAESKKANSFSYRFTALSLWDYWIWVRAGGPRISNIVVWDNLNSQSHPHAHLLFICFLDFKLFSPFFICHCWNVIYLLFNWNVFKKCFAF